MRRYGFSRWLYGLWLLPEVWKGTVRDEDGGRIHDGRLYKLKAAICIVLYRQAKKSLYYSIYDSLYGERLVTIAQFNWHTLTTSELIAADIWGTHSRWDEILVPMDWRDWRYSVEENATY